MFKLEEHSDRCSSAAIVAQCTLIYTFCGKMPAVMKLKWSAILNVICTKVNPFNVNYSKMLLFEAFSAILV